MKKIIFISAIVFMAFRFLGLGDTLRELNISEKNATELISRSICSGYPIIPNAAHKIVDALRPGIVSDMIALAKRYTKTDEFKERYAALREEQKPKQPEFMKFAAESRKSTIIDMKKQIEEYKKSIVVDMPKDQREMIQQMISGTEETIKHMEATPPDEDGRMDTMAMQVNEQMKKEYDIQRSVWEQRYPPNYIYFLRTRLQEYLDLVAQVDFNAELKTEKDRFVFVNPEYESKDGIWKQCFRAGKDANERAQKLIREWMLELQ